jgi:FkbM family methyltransferase
MRRETRVRVIVWSAVAALGLLVAVGLWWVGLPPPVPPSLREVLPGPALAELRARYGPKLYSEYNEETLIRDFFHDRRGGFFVDVGSGHFKSGSTTFYLEEKLGWTGIAVDANADFAADYARYRPRTRFFAYFVTDCASDAHAFFMPGDSTMLASGSKEYASRFGVPVKELTVPAISLDALLARDGVRKVDFVSMDIELGEPGALAGFDIATYRPELVCIEMHRETEEKIRAYFAAHEYSEVVRYAPLDRVNRYFTPAPERGSPRRAHLARQGR